MTDHHPDLPLGQQVDYPDQYDPSQLYSIERSKGREQLEIADTALPFVGEDLWTAYEISWLNLRGKPQVACGEFHFRASSPNIVESKSLKLYLNSFNQSRFEDLETVRELIQQDLSAASGEKVRVALYAPEQWAQHLAPVHFHGDCIDDLDVAVEHYLPAPELLVADAGRHVEETLYSHLLRSRCPVTGQPDWASVAISYAGPAIERESLLKYLVSYRENDEFHEQCVERIFSDLQKRCGPQSLTVNARYLRRGGLDINPIRSSSAVPSRSLRGFRQ